jgi:hypothetical protein
MEILKNKNEIDKKEEENWNIEKEIIKLDWEKYELKTEF